MLSENAFRMGSSISVIRHVILRMRIYLIRSRNHHLVGGLYKVPHINLYEHRQAKLRVSRRGIYYVLWALRNGLKQECRNTVRRVDQVAKYYNNFNLAVISPYTTRGVSVRMRQA